MDITTVSVEGFILDIEGNPVEETVRIGLNKAVTQYKTGHNLNGAEKTVLSSDVDGFWFSDLPDTTNMTADTYYRFTINQRIYRKKLEDTPAVQNLNELIDYP